MPADTHNEPVPFLVTLLPSTDVDLGRWLLQHYAVSYQERPHAPVFHALALKWYGFSADDYPLFVAGVDKIPTIDKLLPYLEARAPAERRLLPEDAALREQVIAAGHEYRFGLGGGVVDWAYYNFLPHRRLTSAAFTTGVPWFEKLLVPLAYPLIRRLMTRALRLDAAKAEQGLAAVRAGFDRVDAQLADGREFLYGEHLTYADLAFAAAAAPMVLARGYGGHLPSIEEVTPQMQEVMRALRARPAGAFIQQMYDRYRGGAHAAAAAPCSPLEA
ncbi:MAG TPA: glutathione S-transferase C-terminal domain-containing protein [Nitrococcus sp.]|nr:glutathione S-transferase C-terminal domain-containing protein [Nitrococcus sp.]